MPSNKTVYTLDLNVSDAIKHYEDLLKTLKTAGGDPKAISDLESSLVKLKSRFGDLKTEAATGFTDSKGLTKFSKGVGDISIKMQQLGTKIKDVASNADNFPNSEFAQAAKEIEKINSQFDNLAKTANSDLIKSLGSMGFSKEQAANIAASVHSEEELVAKLEEEKKRRMEVSEAAKQGLNIVKQQISQEYMSKGGKTAIFGIDLISSTIKSEFDDSKGTLETFEELAKDHLVNALAKGMDPQNAIDGIISFAETFESELGEGFTDAIKKALEDATPTIEGVVSNITTKVNASKEGKAYSAASASYQAIGDPGGGLNANATATASGYGASIEKLNALMERATELTASLDAKQQALINTQNSLKSNADSANQELEQQTNAAQQDANAMANAARESEQLSASFDQMASRVKNLLSIGTIFNTIKNVIKQTFNDVQNLDKSFASIAMVTDQTVSGLWGSYDQYATLASKLGQSTNDVVQASALFYQQGLNTAEALSLTEDTMKLATLAGNDFKTATSEMTAALRGFKMEMDEGGHVTDVYSELAAHAAASVDDIALAMQRTASIANSAGMSFENTSAFLTQMIETTQESAENIGTSMKTIIARFTELKDNVAGTADSEFDDLDFNKVDTALKSVGVSLKDTSGQFRNLDEVFLELSSKWDSLDRNAQRYVATIAAGSRQQSRFIAMMDNYDRTVELMETAADAEGKADEQFEKYADTMEYKLNQLSTTWEQFRVDLMDTDLFNPIIEKVTQVVAVFNNTKIGFNFDTVKLISGLAVLLTTLKNNIIKFLSNAKQFTASAKKLGEDTGKLVVTSATKSAKKLLKKNKLTMGFSNKLEGLDKAIADAKKQMDGLKAKYSNEQLKILVNVESKDLESFKDMAADASKRTAEFTQKAAECDMTVEEFAETLKKISPEEGQTLGELGNHVKEINENFTVATEKEKNIEKMTSALGGTMSVAFNAAASSLAGIVTGTMSTSEAMKSLGIQVGVYVGQTLLQLGVDKISAAVKAKLAAAKAADAAAQTTENAAAEAGTVANTGLAISEYAVLWPLLLIAVAAAAVVVALVAIIGTSIETAKRQKEAADASKQYESALEDLSEAKANLSEQKTELKDLQDSKENVEDIVDEYQTLQKKQKKTTEDYERMSELSEEIKENYPSIVASTDEVTGYVQIAASAYEDIKDHLNDQIEKQEKVVKLAEAQCISAQQTVDAYDAMTKLNSTLGFNLDATSNKDMQNMRGLLNGSVTMDRSLNTYYTSDGYSYQAYGGSLNGGEDGGSYKADSADSMLRNFSDSLKDANAGFEDLEWNSQEMVDAFNYVTGASDNLSDQFDYDMIETLNNFKNTINEVRESLSHFDEFYETTKQRAQEIYSDADYTEGQTNIIGAIAAQRMDEALDSKSFADLWADAITNVATSDHEIDSSDNVKEVIALMQSSDYFGGMVDAEEAKALGDSYQALYDAVAEGVNGSRSWDKVKNELKDNADAMALFERMGITDADSYEKVFGSGDVADAVNSKEVLKYYYSDLLNMALENEGNYELDEEGQDQAIVDAFGEFQANISDMSAQEIKENWEEIESQMEAAGWGEEQRKVLRDQLDMSQTQAEGLANDMQNLFAGKADDLKNSTQQLLKQTFEEASDAIGSEELAQKYTNDLLDAFQSSGIDESLWASLTPDWSNITDDESYEKAKEEWIKNAQDLGVINAEELWESMSDSAERWGALEIPLDVDKFLEDFDKAQEAIESLGGSIEKVTKDMTDNGEVSFSNFQTLKEDLEAIGKSIYDYVDIDSNGKITATEEQLEELLKAQLEGQKQKLEEEKLELDVKVAELENQQMQLKAQLEAIDAGDKTITVFADINEQSAAIYKNWVNIVKAMYEAKGETYNGDLGEAYSVDIKSLSDEDKAKLRSSVESTLLSVNTVLDGYHTKQQAIDDELENWDKYEAAYMRDHLNNMYEAKGVTTDTAKAQEDYNKALKDYDDQLKTVAEKQETLNEKLETYNDLLYGSDNRKSTLDYLYNYDEAIKSFNDQISRSQDILKDASSVEEATAALQDYATATHNLIAEETAKQQVLQAGLANYANQIENGSYSYTNQETGETTNVNFGDYVRKDDRTGKYVIDQRLINESRFGDDWKDLLETQVSNYNKYSEDLLASEDNVRKAEKALRDERENALKSYTALEDKVKEVLKAEYQEQIDNLTNMYDSMKEADDDYVNALQDAIDKQRALREQENAWEDLAKKEKKLSLMQRDTSGANQVETMKLEEEIQDNREKLLDDAIDDVIEGLSDLYESQSELRDAELELKEALLENDSYWAGLSEATVQGFTDLDGATEWYLQHSLELTDKTAAGAEADILGFQDTYSSATEYMAMQLMDETSETGDFINDAINVTGEEAMEIIAETSETFTTEAQRAFDETQATFEADMEKAEQDIRDAKEELQKAVDKLGELAAAANAAAEAYAAAKRAQEELNGNDAEDTPSPSPTSSASSTTKALFDWVDLKNTMNGMSYEISNNGSIDSGTFSFGANSSFTHAQLANYVQKLYQGNEMDELKRIAGVMSLSTTKNNGSTALNTYELYDKIKQRMIASDNSLSSVFKFAEGGLVDYTGPAWVDGTTSRPEAFLSADDTERIGNAARILADIPWIDRDTDNSTVVTNNGGDVSVEINLNIDHISSDTDIDDMIERVKEEIVEVARPTGTNVILQQQL